MNLRIVCVSALAIGVLACANKPKQAGSRESGQSRLMGQTFAGQNQCNPTNHLRPFIIEWDATDMSSFESYAANDIVFVRYEGCTLTVLDECRNDSIRGSQGAYKPPEWTSGSLEKIDISNEGELYANLPLGSASLGGRVAGGEAFHMEYYVAGTRSATRSAVHRADIANNPACADATHFVYAYNLGAFALGSKQKLQTEVGGSFYGFGAGGKSDSKRSAEKQGGDLGTCKSDSATEVLGCKAPIRLTLREIKAGQSAEQQAMEKPDDAESLTAAVVIDTKLQMSEQARAHLEAAKAKAQSGDGKGCLEELDRHDKVDPKQDSQDPKSKYSAPRAQCLLMVGKCDAGRDLARKSFSNMYEKEWGAEHVDKMVEALVAQHCQGGQLGDRDKLLRAVTALEKGALVSKQTVAHCDEHMKTFDKLVGKVKPKDADDDRINNLRTYIVAIGPGCFAKAGDCKKAWTAFKRLQPAAMPQLYEKMDEAQKEQSLRSSFESINATCKGK